MLVMRTTEDPADPIRELVSAEQSVGLDHFALAVYPFGFDGVKPRVLFRQQAAHNPYSGFAPLSLTRRLCFPSQRLSSLETCQLALSQMSSRTFLPRASSFSQHRERNCVVMELTGRPSTK